MPRKPREEVEGGVHHVFARGNRRQLIYLDDADRHTYLWMLDRMVVRQRWRCLTYCLMKNHVHLLVETPRPNLGAGMQRLHGEFAQLFNERHRRSGHLFQGRYGAVRIKSDEQFWTAAAYVAANPVAAGLCDAAEDWLWSSHRAVLSGDVPPFLDVDRLLSFYDSLGGEALDRYREGVAARSAG